MVTCNIIHHKQQNETKLEFTFCLNLCLYTCKDHLELDVEGYVCVFVRECLFVCIYIYVYLFLFDYFFYFFFRCMHSVSVVCEINYIYKPIID